MCFVDPHLFLVRLVVVVDDRSSRPIVRLLLIHTYKRIHKHIHPSLSLSRQSEKDDSLLLLLLDGQSEEARRQTTEGTGTLHDIFQETSPATPSPTLSPPSSAPATVASAAARTSSTGTSPSLPNMSDSTSNNASNPVTLVACNGVDPSSPASTDETVQVEFYYNVETDTVTSPTGVTDTVAATINSHVLQAIQADHCPTQRRSRNLEIATVSALPDDSVYGPWEIAMAANSMSCTIYRGLITVGYTTAAGTDNSDAAAVTTSALNSIETTLGTANAQNDLNTVLAGTGVTVTGLVYGGATAGPIATTNQQMDNNNNNDGGNKINLLGILMVTFMSILLIVVILLLCCCIHRMSRRRRRRRPARGKQLDGDDEEFGQHTDDLATDASSTLAANNRRANNDATIVHMEYHNGMASKSPRMDVHKCTSSTCFACNPQLSQQHTALAPARNLLNQRNPSPRRKPKHLRPLSPVELQASSSSSSDDETAMQSRDLRAVSVTEQVAERLGPRVNWRSPLEPPSVQFVRVGAGGNPRAIQATVNDDLPVVDNQQEGMAEFHIQRHEDDNLV